MKYMFVKTVKVYFTDEKVQINNSFIKEILFRVSFSNMN